MLFAIDCQNRASSSALAAVDGGCCAGETADGAAEAGTDAATAPGCSRGRRGRTPRCSETGEGLPDKA